MSFSTLYKSLGALSSLTSLQEGNQVLILLPNNDGTQGTEDTMGASTLSDFKTYLLIDVDATLAAQDTRLTDAEAAIVNLNAEEGALAFRNKVINGNFDFWQRGWSLTAASLSNYLADRWIERAIGSTIAPSRQAFAFGQTDVPGNPRYFHRAVVASVAGADNSAYNEYRVEGVTTLAGQDAILSFWAKADAPRNIGVSFAQVFGSSGSPSLPVSNLGVTQLALTTTWSKYEVSVTLPSIAGKTLGTAGNDSLRFDIWYDAGANSSVPAAGIGQQSGTFDIAQVQLEKGTTATAFEERPLSLELSLCQRYFWTSYTPDEYPGLVNAESALVGFSTASSNFCVIFQGVFPTAMRITPALSLYSPKTGAVGMAYRSNILADIAAYTTGLSSVAFTANVNGTTSQEGLKVCAAADAEI